MKYVRTSEHGIPMVELTRHNLMSLLAKLDGNPPGSKCTIVDPEDNIAVKAVEDIEHYRARPPGQMHLDTEEALRRG